MKYNPIIIIGMHRSGTSMLSKILEDSDIFLGNNKDINNEALFSKKSILGLCIRYMPVGIIEPILNLNKNELTYLKDLF